MLLNISAFLLTMMLGIIPVALGAVMHKSQTDNPWFVKNRGKVLISLILGVIATIVLMSICMYEITQIQNRLRAEVLMIQEGKL